MRIALVICALLFAPLAYAGESTSVTIYTKNGELNFDAEIVSTVKQRAIGMQNRTTLGETSGMLFVFPQSTNTGFWMKDTLIALDMLFIDENFTIVHIEHNALPHTLENRQAGQPYIAVLEIRGGTAQHLGISREDRVRFVLPEGLVIQ